MTGKTNYFFGLFRSSGVTFVLSFKSLLCCVMVFYFGVEVYEIFRRIVSFLMKFRDDALKVYGKRYIYESVSSVTEDNPWTGD